MSNGTKIRKTTNNSSMWIEKLKGVNNKTEYWNRKSINIKRFEFEKENWRKNSIIDEEKQLIIRLEIVGDK